MYNLDRALVIDGWMSGPELTCLAELAQKSHKILEVGCYKGRTSRVLLDNTGGSVTCVDCWDGNFQVNNGNLHQNGGDMEYTRFCGNIWEFIKSGKARVHRCKFEDFESQERYDLIFLDALHDYESVKKDIEKAMQLIAPGGIIAGHDYRPSWAGVIKAVDEKFDQNFVLYESIWIHVVS
jgi:predicted O-methyltransferase YrrM